MRSRPLLTAVALATGLITVLSAVVPEPAAAIDLGLGLPSVGDMAVGGFKAILEFFFGDIDGLGKNIIGLLLAVPLLTDHDVFPKLNDYREYVQAGAWGILGLTPVVAALRYFVAGMTSTGSYEAIQGVIRGAAAVAMLLVFLPAFDQVCRFVNAMTAALAVNPVTGAGMSKNLATVFDMSTIQHGGIGLIITIVAIVAAIVLLVVKVIITTLLAVLFVASPLAIALWPIEELAWALRTLLQAIVGLLAFPILWALCFSVFSVLSADALFPGDHGSTITGILAPMISLAALIIAFRLPFAVLSQAMGAGIAPGLNRGLGHVRSATNIASSAATSARNVVRPS